MFQRNPFYQNSDESVEERNRLLLTTKCHIKRDNLNFPFIVSYIMRMSHLKGSKHTSEKRCFSLYIKLSIIFQAGGVVNIIAGIEAAATIGKFDFWYL